MNTMHNSDKQIVVTIIGVVRQQPGLGRGGPARKKKTIVENSVK